MATLTQVSPEQQPEGHEVASQMQALFTQREPDPQAGPKPQRQVPLSQLSAPLVQAEQVAPLRPQAAVVTAVMQVVPWQQPAQLT